MFSMMIVMPNYNPTPNHTLQDLLEQRHSCRAFLAQPVEREIIERILQLAQRTASWCNAQPWQVHVVSGAATDRFRAGLRDYRAAREPAPDFPFPARYEGVYQERRRTCGFQLYEAVGVARGDREASGRQAARNFELFDAPQAVFITTEADLGIYGAVDCGAYVSNFMLAAQNFGVASIAQAALANYPDYIREFFDLPESRRVVCAVSFGYEDRAHPANRFRTERAAVTDSTQWQFD